MTNREIREHNHELAKIMKSLGVEQDKDFKQRRQRLADGKKRLEQLADAVGACKYLGSAFSNVDEIITDVMKGPISTQDSLARICTAYEITCREIHYNIHYTLQTEEMLNACISARWSCFWAALAAGISLIAAIASVVSVVWVK